MRACLVAALHASLILALGPWAGPLQAQVDSARKKPTPADSALVDTLQKEAQQEVLAEAHRIQLWEIAGAAVLVATSTVLDRPLHRETREHRNRTLTNLANAFRQEGEPAYYAGISLGVYGVGLVSGSPEIRRAGRRLVVSVAASAVVMEGMKMLVGRSRPNENRGPWHFSPFTSLKDSAGIEARGSFPSGHTTAAFAVATSLADDINYWPVSVVLYTLAAGTGFSRVYDNRHWFSDTVAGAILGITTAKVVSGHWRIFGLKPPGWLVTPTGAPAVEWRVPLPRLR